MTARSRFARSRSGAVFGSPGRSRRAPGRGDDGSATPELVIVLPAMMLLLALSIQLAMFGLAAQALDDAVSFGGAVLRSQSGGSAAARTAVLAELRTIASGVTSDTRVSILAGPSGNLELSASASVTPVFPGLNLVVRSMSSGPSQSFRASG